MQPGRLDWLHEMVDPVPIHVLGYTVTGEPRHPLYMRKDYGHRAA